MVFRRASRLLALGLSVALSVSFTGVAALATSTDTLLADSGSTNQWHKTPTPKKGHVTPKSKKPHKSTKNLQKGKKNSLHSKARPKKPLHKSLGGSLTRTT
jgi:hypothetical protein